MTASTIHMSLLGPKGLRKVATTCHQNLKLLQEKLKKVDGVRPHFSTHAFHEMVIEFKKPVERILTTLAKNKIQAGFHLKKYYPELGNCLLVCVTETKTPDDLNLFVSQLEKACQN